MSFVDGMLMEYMKFLCKWRTIVIYGPGKWKFLALGWLVKIHMEWDGGFASFLVMLPHVPIPSISRISFNTTLTHAYCV